MVPTDGHKKARRLSLADKLKSLGRLPLVELDVVLFHGADFRFFSFELDFGFSDPSFEKSLDIELRTWFAIQKCGTVPGNGKILDGMAQSFDF